jgi:hypothetical protein
MKIEKRYCKECNEEVDHIRVIVKSQNTSNVERKSKLKEFISALIAGWGAGSTAGFMELRDVHLICKNCGNKIIERYRGDL